MADNQATSKTWGMNFQTTCRPDESSKAVLVYTGAEVKNIASDVSASPVTIQDWSDQIALNSVPSGKLYEVRHDLTPYVNFDHCGLEGVQVLDVPDSGHISPNLDLGRKENLRIEAVIRPSTSCDLTGVIHTVDRDDQTPMIEVTDDGGMEHKKLGACNAYGFINPIVYMDQSGGFMLLAELRKPESGESRLLFSIVMNGEQFHVVSVPYTPLGKPYKVSVQQDGDSRLDNSYFEFKFRNSYKIGHLDIGTRAFPFFADGPTRICIGCWPREQGSLFFHGDIISIDVDPHGLCPC